MDREPVLETTYDALVLALSLAVTAPTEEQAQRATEMAERIAASMDAAEVESAQLAAELLAAEDSTCS